MLHGLDTDSLVTPTLLRRFRAEALLDGGDGRFHALIVLQNGLECLSHREPDDVGQEAPPHSVALALEILTRANKELNFGGAWVCVFTHYFAPAVPRMFGEYLRLTFIWLDQDGDPQFSMETDDPYEAMRLRPWSNEAPRDDNSPLIVHRGWGNDFALAHEAWTASRRALDLRSGETHRRAKGERAQSRH